MYEKPVADFSTRLREAIERRGVTAADLSRETQISTSAISRYLKGEFTPKQDKMHALAISLRVSPAWLMGYDVDMDGKIDDNHIIIPSKKNREKSNKVLQDFDIDHIIPMSSFEKDDYMAKFFSCNSDDSRQFLIYAAGIYNAIKPHIMKPADKELVDKYHELDESSQLLVKGMIDKLLLAQQMAQKNATTADSDGEENTDTQKGTPSLQQVPSCEKTNKPCE